MNTQIISQQFNEEIKTSKGLQKRIYYNVGSRKALVVAFVALLGAVFVTLTLSCGCSNNKQELQTQSDNTLEAVTDFSATDQLTAFGGADINSEEMQEVKSQLQEITDTGKKVSFIVVNPKNQKGFAYMPDRVMPAKSTIKAPYLTSLIMDSTAVLDNDMDAVKKTITYSDNDSYKYLRNKYGEDVFVKFGLEAGVDVDKLTPAKYPLNFTVRDMAKLWSKMYPFMKENLNTNGKLGEYLGYFKCTAYSPFSTLMWRDNDVISKAGWDEGITVADDGQYEKVPSPEMIDGDPLNNEEAMNDTGIVSSKNGDYIFVYFTDFPAISDIMYPLIQSIDDAGKSLS